MHSALQRLVAFLRRPFAPSRAELAERLARCEALLAGLRVEQGVVIAEGFVALDADGLPVLVGFGAARRSTATAPDDAALTTLLRTLRSGA